MAKGLLVAAFDFSTAHEDEFHDWYAHEHIPERLAVPGFLKAERWVGIEDARVHVATYELADGQVLRSAAYLARSDNPTPWTRRVTGMSRRIMRFDGEQLVPGEADAPDGAAALLLASMNVAEAALPEFHKWYDTEHLPSLAAVPGVLAARRYVAKDTASERRFLALYHLADAGVSHSEAWTKAARTSWSARMQPHLADLMVLRMNRFPP